jgi:uncharacterized protein YndB with AHSA1/START domain
MGKTSATIDLPFAIDDIFRVATRVEDLPRWLPEVVDAELVDGELVAGARIRLRLGPGTGNAEITGTVAELRPPTLLEITGSGGPLSIKLWTMLAPLGPGATRVSLQVELSTPPFLGFIAKEAERRISAELPASLERFRTLMEDDQAG